MAERRMFSKSIIDSDMFLDMPQSCQLLYFHLAMRADDDGFINNPKRIMRDVGCHEDDLRVLAAKKFIIPFDNGVVVIKHWRIHNYIRKDTYHETRYKQQKDMLMLNENGEYIEKFSDEIPAICDDVTNPSRNCNDTLTQDRIGKDRLGKDRIGNIGAKSKDSPPTDTVIELILNDQSLYPITQSQIDEWKTLYPAVDIVQELRKMKGWLIANPSKRKTKRGILRFVNNWLSREQDRGGSNAGQATNDEGNHVKNSSGGSEGIPKYGKVF